MCESLIDPDGGSVKFDDPTPSEGSRAKYTCQENYKLNGDSSRTCRSNGTWDGRAPTCTSKYTMLQLFLYFSSAIINNT